VLALLSPCSALLLPAFFAYAFQGKRELTAKTAVFYLGLATIFVPLGMGASLATTLVIDHRDTLIVGAGVMLIGFGALELAGRSLTFMKMSGGTAEETRSLLGVYGLGTVYGFGGFCSGPILGSVLTVAATDDNVLRGGALLATYALGTVLPLFVLAAVWDRAHVGEQRWLRGRGFELGPLSIHSTNLIAGVLFIVLGLSFILLRGTNALAGTYEGWGLTDVSFEADRLVKEVTGGIPDLAVLTLLGGLVAAASTIAIRRLRRNGDWPTDGPWEKDEKAETTRGESEDPCAASGLGQSQLWLP
jgi:cytochrome c biogenesis protein CcdA